MEGKEEPPTQKMIGESEKAYSLQSIIAPLSSQLWYELLPFPLSSPSLPFKPLITLRLTTYVPPDLLSCSSMLKKTSLVKILRL